MPENLLTPVSAIGTIFVPVSDQDRAITFYTERLGFEKRADFGYGGDMRWVEVGPRDSAIGLALVSPAEGTAVSPRTALTRVRGDSVAGDSAVGVAAPATGNR